MRTSLIELQQIEAHIFGTHGGNQLPDAAFITDAALAEKVEWQKDTYAMVNQYGRQKLKTELETIHRKLFTEPRYARFRRHIMRLFR